MKNLDTSLTSPALALTLRAISIDDYSSVRFTHATAARAYLAGLHSDDEIAEIIRYIYGVQYVDELQLEDLIGAWLDGELIGTAGWTPADDHGKCARITSLTVRPLFARLGIGTRLLKDAEARARRAGFDEFSMRVPRNTVALFKKAGYEVTSRGIQPIGNTDLAVAFMRKRKLPAIESTHLAQPAAVEHHFPATATHVPWHK